MRARRIRLRGTGPAALAAARLLLDRGAEVVIDAPAPRKRRIVSVPMETLALAAQLFGTNLRDLMAGIVVHERRVDWSADGPATMPQLALVCDIGDLSAVLARSLHGVAIAGDADGVDAGDDDADWIIDATGRPAATGLRGGERVGYFARIDGAAPESMTSITATKDGWIFTSPHPDGGLAVLLVAPSLAAADPTPDGIAAWLERASRTIPAAAVVEVSRPEPIAPRLSSRLCDSNRLVAGDAALALDPLRGDGTGFALRGALLAQAVVAAVEHRHDRSRCFSHYEKRVRCAFLGHLRGCSDHYRASRYPRIWEGDVAAMDELAAQLDRGTETFDLRLAGVDLVPMAATAVNAASIHAGAS
ncbi:MAG TPA: hypothetical protein VEZ11_18620 [Thermoanaerobaculia bacterium]|nr:hypothetical protein [Thermoanaerobaculia bacterium]